MRYERTDPHAARRSRLLRAGVLAAVFVVVTGFAYAHQNIRGADKPVGVDALCPFGGLETLFSLLVGGTYVQRIAASSVVLLVGAVVLALVFRRSFCGQICPLGALQGVFGAAGARLLPQRPSMPRWLDRPARFLKYAVLGVFLLWTWNVGQLVMRPYDPWAAWAHITSPELLTEFGVGAAVLGISLAGSVVYDRFFCKYACPMGAFLALFSRWSVLRIVRSDTACIDCARCDHACPMGVDVSTAGVMTDAECISCNECVNACPAAGALEVRTTRRPVSPALTTGIVIAVLAAAIGLGSVTGRFDLTMPSLAEAVERHGAGTFDPTLIKGYMSMREISEATGIPESEFSAAFGVPAEQLGVPMKEIKDAYGFSPHDVSGWVAERLAQP